MKKSFFKKKFQLLLRNSENLSESKILEVNLIKVILLIALFLILTFSFTTFIVRKVLYKWIDPTYLERANSAKLLKLNGILNELEEKINKQNEFISLLQNQIKLVNKTRREIKVLPITEEAKKETKIEKIKTFNEKEELKSMNKKEEYYIPPLKGVITSKLNFNLEHFGIDIVSKKNEPVKNILDGTVIFSSWTLYTGYVIIVQHNNSLISVYKHNSKLLKKIGEKVKKGEALAIIGSSGEFSSGPHLHFEMWKNGLPINPEDYLIF